jgi:hypothetical protein
VTKWQLGGDLSITKSLLLAATALVIATSAQAQVRLPDKFNGTWCLVPSSDLTRDAYVRENCVYEKNGEIIVRGGVRKGKPNHATGYMYGEEMLEDLPTDLQAIEIRGGRFNLVQFEAHEPASRTTCRVLSFGQNGLVKMLCDDWEGPLYNTIKQYWLRMDGNTLYVRFHSSQSARDVVRSE